MKYYVFQEIHHAVIFIQRKQNRRNIKNTTHPIDAQCVWIQNSYRQSSF